MSISFYDESEGFVTARQWNKIIAEHEKEISKAKAMASWFAGTDRMSDTTTLNVVIYEDGEVKILCRDKCEEDDYVLLDDNYFRNNRALYCLSCFERHNPIDEVFVFNHSKEIKKLICDLVKRTHKEKEFNDMVKEIYEDNEYESYEEVDCDCLMFMLEYDEEVYNLLRDYQAFYRKEEYDDTYSDYIYEGEGSYYNKKGRPEGIAHNKYMFYDGLHDCVVEEYNKFIELM